MKKLVEIGVGLFLLLSFFASCTVITGVSVFTMDQKHYTDLSQVYSGFPLLLVTPTGEYQFVQWSYLQQVVAETPGATFLMPKPEITMKLDEYRSAEFHLIDQQAGRQVIKVEYSTDNYGFSGTYEAEEKQVFPKKLRGPYPNLMHVFIALAIGLVLTALLFYGAKRGVKRALKSRAPDLDVTHMHLIQATTELLMRRFASKGIPPPSS